MVIKDGQNLGVMTADRARWLARQEELDLVEVNSNTNPPVCRILDYSKFKYEQSIKEKEKSKQPKTQVKEVKLGPATADHDILVKAKAVERFIADGDKVVVKVEYRRRQKAHKELGFDVMSKLIQAVEAVATPQRNPSFNGDTLTCILEPKKS